MSRRVYTIALMVVLACGVLVAGLATRAPAPAAEDRLTIEPRMTRGPARAPVTIVEFSDFQ